METFFLALGYLVLGCCFGSFASVFLDRDMNKRSFWTGKAYCVDCNASLHWYQHLPIVSYLFQGEKCEECEGMIPHRFWRIEWVSGVIWMVFGTLLLQNGFPLIITGLHLIILTFLIILAIEDAHTMAIPDRLSLPMIVITLIAVSFVGLSGLSTLLPTIQLSLLGGILGLLFYSLQVMIPAIWHELGNKNFSLIPAIIFLPFLFLGWIAMKVILGEKTAERLMPSVNKIDALPSWVSGGDVRLGILVGLIVGPVDFVWVIAIGYCIGALYWGMSKLLINKDLVHAPLAPLLFLGVAVMWIMKLI